MYPSDPFTPNISLENKLFRIRFGKKRVILPQGFPVSLVDCRHKGKNTNSIYIAAGGGVSNCYIRWGENSPPKLKMSAY